MIAVTGASGAVGGRVAERLAHHGEPMRLLVRDAARAPALEGAEVAAGASYDDPEAMRRGFEGADGATASTCTTPPQTLADFLRANPRSYAHLTAG